MTVPTFVPSTTPVFGGIMGSNTFSGIRKSLLRLTVPPSHITGGQVVAGSNPVAPTIFTFLFQSRVENRTRVGSIAVILCVLSFGLEELVRCGWMEQWACRTIWRDYKDDGSFTIVSQKSSIEFMTRMNCFRLTGFVM